MTFSDEGILGLSLPHPGSPLPVFIQAVREGLMDAPVFTTYMRKCDGSCRDGGLITLGGLDVNHCGQVVGWIPIARDSVHWRFKMDRVQTSSFVSKDPIDAITDTGTSFIIGKSFNF
jgi:hypothetical protein